MKRGVAVAFLFILSFAMLHLPAYASASPAKSPTSLLVPLYSAPGSEWTALIQERQVDPGVPMVAIVNPSNGPGASPSQEFTDGIQRLQEAGISVLGYVDTSYGDRNITVVKAEIGDYMRWYGVNGTFLDEMADSPGHEAYYSALTTYSHEIGAYLVIGNPGHDVPSSYVGTVDTLVIAENASFSTTSFLGGWHSEYPKSDFAAITYGAALNQSYLEAASRYIGYLYVTNGALPNPYLSLPSYLGSLVTQLAGLEPINSPPVNFTPVAVEPEHSVLSSQN